MTSYTIFGTDTGVGKTIVTAALASVALAAGLSARVLKPLQTGADEDDDGAEVDRLVGQPVSQTGWRLRAPLAPVVAARLEGLAIDPREVVAWSRRGADADLNLVETAGGCAVEIAEGYEMADLGRELGWPALVVARPGLGTLNHTLLTVEHLRYRGVSVDGIILSGAGDDPDIAERTNPAELERVCEVPIVGVVPLIDLRAEPAAFLARVQPVLQPVVRSGAAT